MFVSCLTYIWIRTTSIRIIYANNIECTLIHESFLVCIGAGSEKPRLGKNHHHEDMKTKRDIEHDHHLARNNKGMYVCFVRMA